jgi:hypothetical protein
MPNDATMRNRISSGVWDLWTKVTPLGPFTLLDHAALQPLPQSQIDRLAAFGLSIVQSHAVG